jgi:hypothetical protein
LSFRGTVSAAVFVAGGECGAVRECVNTLTLTKVADAVLTFDELDVPGTCVGGTVTLTRKGNALTYRWTDDVEEDG